MLKITRMNETRNARQLSRFIFVLYVFFVVGSFLLL
jgi:hypothetical protein